MKIILAVNTLGSFISHRRGLYLKLKESHDVRVILPTSETKNSTQKEIPEAQLLNIPMSRKGVNPLTELGSIVAYYQQYRKNTPDLVHHFTIKPVIYGTLAARLAGVPKIVNSITGLGFVFTSNSLKAKILGVLVKNLYRFCFSSPKVRVIFQNTDDRDFFVQQRIIQEDRCFLVEGSGVDVHKFTPSPNSDSVMGPKILLASRLLIEKGIFEFIEALKLLKRKNLQFEVVIAGDIDPGNPGSISESQFNEWKRSGIANFLGFQKDMVSILKSIDIACLPSYREGLPMALLEAMAAGKPLVTTEAPGCRSTVREQKNGFLVPIKDPQALAKALEKLISNPALREQMGEESRRISVELFSTEKITSEIIKIYSV
ncbi:MAG TPA: glycosyltransferase family 4 protein [Pseudobdellovibrionaceae bacterium]|jgi:glycosyltransferase involved in cell wall biosynthesis